MADRRRRSRSRSRSRRRRFLTAWLLPALAVPIFALAAATFALRSIPPPTTSVMLQRSVQAWLDPGARLPPRQRWVDWGEIAPEVAIAVVASEDQKFPRHAGFDLEAIADAMRDRPHAGPRRGASTISQQVAKNLFLWSGRSLVRKGLEAGLAAWLELAWPKRRILEVYLNVAEFGDGIFGVAVASETFFGKAAADLRLDEAALLAAVLPSPARLRADRPSPYVRERAAWIAQEVASLGGPAYLGSL